MSLLPETPIILTAEQVYRGWTDEPEQGEPASPDPTPEPDDVETIAERIAALVRP